MPIEITGSRRRAPWQGALRVLIVAFWTTIIAEAQVFFVVFLATAIILWVNGSLAFRFAQSQWTQRPAEFEWKPAGVASLPEIFEFMRHRLPWRFAIICGACALPRFVPSNIYFDRW